MKELEKFPKITDEGVNNLRQFLGKELEVKDPFNQYATPDTIRHFAHGMGDTNPLFTDEEYGKKSRWGTIIAPPTFLFSCFTSSVPQGLPGVHGLWSGASFEMEDVIRAGTRIQATVALSGLTPKETRIAGHAILQEFTYTFHNAEGGILGKARERSMRIERDAGRKRGKYKVLEPAHYTPEDIDRIYGDCDKEEIRGATPRYWEDVTLGQELAPIVKGPLRITDVVAWKIGWGFRPFCFAHKIAVDKRKRHPLAYIPDKYGIPDIPERVHWQPEFAQQIGLPAAYDYGPQRVSWLCQVVSNWTGDDGFIQEFWADVIRISLIGDTHWLRGKVTKKRKEDGRGLVEMDLWGDDQRGETTIRGGATVVLPCRNQ